MSHVLLEMKKYLAECIDTTFVSYVGAFVNTFENMVVDYTKSKYAMAVSNGTLGLHIALVALGVKPDDEVITQALTFVATANAISYTGAESIFLDSDRTTLGLCPEKLESFLSEKTEQKEDGYTYNKKTGKRIFACIPVHIFGHPSKIVDIINICEQYNIKVIEDAAESLGSWYNKKHTGTFGKIGVLSFNGNKTITTGGGGMLLTDDESIAQKIKHLSTTAKIPHTWEFVHDEIGYNYRMPNINAAVGCAQMEKLELFLEKKRELAEFYVALFAQWEIPFIKEPDKCISNYWLNAIILENKKERDAFLEYTNRNGVMTRPIWKLMTKLPMFKHCQKGDLTNAKWFEERVVNIPSSVRV